MPKRTINVSPTLLKSKSFAKITKKTLTFNSESPIIRPKAVE